MDYNAKRFIMADKVTGDNIYKYLIYFEDYYDKMNDIKRKRRNTMEFFHELKDIDIDLTDAIAGHSADETIAYKEVEGEPIYLGYYFPKNYDRSKKYQTFVFIHGGGWASHKIFDEQPHWQGDHLGYLARYYADKGLLCVSIDYRLLKELGQAAGYELVDCYEDCCDAMDYVLEHADEYGVDINHMYLLGESAGGHLAGGVATFHYDRRYEIERVFLINPITDLYDNAWNKRVPKESAHAKLADLSLDERANFLSPLYQVDEQIGDVILIHGEADTCVNPEHSKSFHRRMQELSKACDLHIIANTQHAFLLAEYTSNITACKMGVDIINQYLKIQ